MKTKFIKGTNKQYSIREDGLVKSYYKKTSTDKIIYRMKVLNPWAHHNIVYVKLQNKSTCLKKLVMSHFGEVKHSRAWAIQHKDNDIFNCAYSNLEYVYRNICNNPNYGRRLTPEERKKRDAIAAKKHTKNISKSYVAASLKIPVKDLSQELYEHHRNLILFKRKISKESGVSMIHLNKL